MQQTYLVTLREEFGPRSLPLDNFVSAEQIGSPYVDGAPMTKWAITVSDDTGIVSMLEDQIGVVDFELAASAPPIPADDVRCGQCKQTIIEAGGHLHDLQPFGLEGLICPSCALIQAANAIKYGVMPQSQFLQRVDDELIRARMKFPPFNSYHEGYAIISEEVDELWDEVKKRPRARSRERLAEETIQIAAMCGRFAEDLKLLEAE